MVELANGGLEMQTLMVRLIEILFRFFVIHLFTISQYLLVLFYPSKGQCTTMEFTISSISTIHMLRYGET